MTDKETINFQCNICGSHTHCHSSELTREPASCKVCSSTVRMRSIIHLLSLNLFGESLTIPDFPERKDLHGVGMSDWITYAEKLAHKLDYTNTFYHQEPKLDITQISENIKGSMDFIISTDVFEHVLSPISIAFTNTLSLLKKEAVFIFTVPYTKEGENTVEHFDNLHDFTIEQTDGDFILKNTSVDGTITKYNDLVFHGSCSGGAMLEMRVFSENSLLNELKNAGFKNIKIHKEPFMKYGIHWGQMDWSLPISATR